MCRVTPPRWRAIWRPCATSPTASSRCIWQTSSRKRFPSNPSCTSLATLNSGTIVPIVKRYPLLPITAAFAAGIGAAPHFYLSAWEQVFLISVILLMAALFLRVGRTVQGLIVSLLGFFLCGTFLTAEEHSVLPPDHIESLVRRS